MIRSNIKHKTIQKGRIIWNAYKCRDGIGIM